MTEALEAARWYISQNLGVFPVQRGGGKEPVPGCKWTKYAVELASDTQLVEWFGGPAPFGVGVPCGRVTVLDFENKRGDAYAEWLEKLPAQVREEAGRLPTVATPSGGRHVWCFTDLPTPSKKLAYYPAVSDENGSPRKITKIEIKGQGGYVLAPGSPAACHDAKKPYEWLNRDGFGVPVAAELWDAMGLAAVACNEFVAPVRATRKVAVPRQSGDDRPGLDAETRAEIYLEQIPGAVQGQNGSDPTFWAARVVVWGFDLGEEAGYRLLERVYNPRCIPPWSEKELRHKCKDADKGPYMKARGFLLNAEPSGHGPNNIDGSGNDWGSITCNGVPMNDFKKSHVPDAAAAADADDDAAEAPAAPPAYEPFPVDALPRTLRAFVRIAARAITCDPSYVTLPLLTVFGAAIGNSRRLTLKDGFHVPPIIWGGCVGYSGTGKTPGLKPATNAVTSLEESANAQSAKEALDYKEKLLCYKKALAAWNRDEGNSPAPKEPEVPKFLRYMVQDVTVEALAPILKNNPRGLLVVRDELAGHFGSYDRYASKGGKGGSDSATWLTMYDAGTLTIDRKTGVPPTIYIPQAAVCVMGGIQPGILRRAMTTDHQDSGMFARFLICMPPHNVADWNDDGVPDAAQAKINYIAKRLYSLEPLSQEDGKFVPLRVSLDSEAKKLWVQYHNAVASEQRSHAHGGLLASLTKLKEYAARLALVIHFVRWAENDPSLTDATVLDAVSMASGVRLSEWFIRQKRAAHDLLDDSVDDQELTKLIEWITKKGGSVETRKVTMGCRAFRKKGQAKEALDKLVDAQLGVWESPNNFKLCVTLPPSKATVAQSPATEQADDETTRLEDESILSALTPVDVPTASSAHEGLASRGKNTPLQTNVTASHSWEACVWERFTVTSEPMGIKDIVDYVVSLGLAKPDPGPVSE